MSILKDVYNYIEEIKTKKRSFQRLMNKGITGYDEKVTRIIKDSLKSIVNRYYFLEWELSKLIKVNDEHTKDYLICALGQYHFVNEISNEMLLSFFKDELNSFDDKLSPDFVYNKFISLNGKTLTISEFENKIIYKRLAVTYSYPEWVCKMLCKHYGYKKAYRAIASSKRNINLSLNVNTLLTTRDEILKKYPSTYEKGTLTDTALKYKGKQKLIDLNAFTSNFFFVEDESKQLLVRNLNLEMNDTCLLINEEKGSTAIDMATKTKDRGLIHVASNNVIDYNAIKTMVERFKIHSLDIFESNVDQLITHVGYGSCDKVLFIAPSSELGLVRKRPDILLTLKKEDIDSILKTQKEQLEEVSKFVKNDGLLEYAVFTYSRKETTKIIKEFTLNHPEFELICDRQIFANDVPSDGVYFALLRKN